jgi:hypothetical protein
MMETMNSRRSLWRAGWLGAILTVIINDAVWLIFRAADISFLVPGFGSDTSPQASLTQVLVNSFVPFIIGTGVAVLVVSRGLGIRGGAVALISLGVPLTSTQTPQRNSFSPRCMSWRVLHSCSGFRQARERQRSVNVRVRSGDSSSLAA